MLNLCYLQHFREAVGQETGLVMNPLPCDKVDYSQGNLLKVPSNGGGSAASSLKRLDSGGSPSSTLKSGEGSAASSLKRMADTLPAPGSNRDCKSVL